MTRMTGTWLRRGAVIAATAALLAAAAPVATIAQSPAAGGEISVMTYFSKELGEAALKDLLKSFEEQSGYTVKFNDVGHEDYKTGILIQLAGGNPPDVHSVWAGARTAFQVQNGMLSPLDDMWAANSLDSQFAPGMIASASTYDGKKYLIPLGYHYAGMFYNPKVFADAGITTMPATWDELKTACATFKGKGIIPISLGSMNKWPAQFWFDYILLRTAGPEYRAKLMAGEASYTDPEVVRTLQLWKELFDAGCFPDGATANGLDWTNAADQVAKGEAAMNLMGTWITGYWDGNKLKAGTDYDFFEFPVIDEGVGNAVVGPVDGMVSAAAAKNHDGAMALLGFLATPDVQTKWAVGQGALAPNVNADTSKFSPVMQKALDVVNKADSFNFNYDLATPPAPSEVGLDMFQKFVADQGDIEGLLKETQDGVAAAFQNQ